VQTAKPMRLITFRQRRSFDEPTFLFLKQGYLERKGLFVMQQSNEGTNSPDVSY
jgi:hypothetical protein